MLHLLLLLLKIIGIVLLAVLGLLLLLLLTVLLVPVRYRAKGSYYEKPEGTLRVTWLCHLVSLKVSYLEKLEISVRVLGFRLFKEKGEKAEETLVEEPILAAQDLAEEMTDPKTEEEILKENSEEPETAEKYGELEEEKRRLEEETAKLRDEMTQLQEETERSGEEKGRPEKAAAQPERETGGTGKKGFFHRTAETLRALVRRVKLACRMAAARFRMALKKKEELSLFLRDEKNRETFRLMKRLALKALRHVFPRKIRGELTFGVEDPYRMGQILTGAALFYPLYHDSFTLTPVFDKKMFEGQASLRGRIRLGTLAFIGLRLFMHKNFRVLLKKFLAQGGN